MNVGYGGPTKRCTRPLRVSNWPRIPIHSLAAVSAELAAQHFRGNEVSYGNGDTVALSGELNLCPVDGSG
jgi:hypothetical protein